MIAAGRRTAPVAQWIRAQSRGRARIVALGRKAGDDAERFDRVVTPSYARLFPHPHRIETGGPLHRVTRDALAKAAEEWADRLGDAPAPRIAVLVGGTSGQYRLGPAEAAQLGAACAQLARACGGSLFATTSRRLGAAATEAFCAAIGEVHFLHRWTPDDPSNPYLGLLAHADAFVITGDSESMLAEATSLGPAGGDLSAARARLVPLALGVSRVGVAARDGEAARAARNAAPAARRRALVRQGDRARLRASDARSRPAARRAVRARRGASVHGLASARARRRRGDDRAEVAAAVREMMGVA